MAQIVVRQLDDDLKAALQDRAKAHGRSTEEEVREILRCVVRSDKRPSPLGSAIAARFRGNGLDTEISELRGEPVRPADVDR